MPEQVSISRDAIEAAITALDKTITHLIVMSDDTPYQDDPRWSPWSRWGHPLCERCDIARKDLKSALAAPAVSGTPDTKEDAL